MALVSISYPIVQLIPKGSILILPTYFILMFGAAMLGVLTFPKISGKIFDKEIRDGCRKYAVHIAENIDDYLGSFPELDEKPAIVRSKESS